MAENDGKVVFELDVDDSQIQGKIDRAIGEMRRAAQSGKNALLSLDADTVAALARLHRVQAESNAARAGAAAQSPASAADSSPAAAPAHALVWVANRAERAADSAGGMVETGASVAKALAEQSEIMARQTKALAGAADWTEQVADDAGGMAAASASAAEALAEQAETLAGQAEVLTEQSAALAGQAEAARGAEASMRSAWASMVLIDGAAARLRTSIQAARDAAGGISGAISGLISRIRSTGVQSGGGGGTNRMSKYAVGLDVVPYDEYPALLHRGEMVLNAAEASAYRMGGRRDMGGTEIDYDRLARAMANVSLEMDGQKVGRLVEKSVSAAQSYRYRRAARKG